MQYRDWVYEDGLGSHIHKYTLNILWAETQGHSIYLSYNTSFEHNYENDQGFYGRMISYINLHKYWGMPHHINECTIPKVPFFDVFKYCEADIDAMLETPVFETIKSRFMENKVDPYDPAFFNVVVHVRRENKQDVGRLGERLIADEYYLNVMKLIREEYASGVHGTKPLKFHIYSQGDVSKFAAYAGEDVEFHLDETPEKTMTGFLFGDILVTSASAMSYSAGFFTSAKVYYKRFWHPPSKKWKVIEL